MGSVQGAHERVSAHAAEEELTPRPAENEEEHMPWEVEAEGIRFSGPLVDLMSLIMTAYDEENAAGRVAVLQGTYVTAATIVLREILLAAPPEPGSEELVARVTDALREDDDGVVTVDTFAMLDDMADHIELDAFERWLADPAVRAAIAEVTESAIPE
jgi:hypothetical protein